jgi:hypothetical protein
MQLQEKYSNLLKEKSEINFQDAARKVSLLGMDHNVQKSQPKEEVDYENLKVY